jgi:hypothetical protein
MHNFKQGSHAMKSFILSTLILTSLAVPALAGSPPTTSRLQPEAVADACATLGAKGESLGQGAGCRNTETGAAVLCTGDQCTDYFADPRYSKIKSLLDASRVRPQQRAL